MALAKPQSNFDAEGEYRAIEQTLIESPRGRWFLSEHGRRARRLDSLTLHDAIAKLQDSLREPPALLGQLQGEIEGLQTLLRETRDAIAINKPAQPSAGKQSEPSPAQPAALATNKASTTAETSGTPTSAGHILSVAESIHALAWDLQAQDLNVDACEQIARQASQMYALSHRHAVESERVRALTDALDGALVRLDGLLETVALEAQFDSINPPARPFDTASDTTKETEAELVESAAPPRDEAPAEGEAEAAPPEATDSQPTSNATPVEAAATPGQPEPDAFDLALQRAREQDTPE
ncbi:MAG: hypothetical protein AAGG99_04335 [Pseudomonadota bacterium]